MLSTGYPLTFEHAEDELRARIVGTIAHPLMLQIRPIAVAMESGQKDLLIIDPKSSMKVNAFHRARGISSLDVSQNPSGVVALKAGWVLKKLPIADTIKHLNETLRWLGNARLLT